PGGFGGMPGSFGGPGFGGPGPTAAIGEILPPFVRDMLSLNDEQREKVQSVQTESDAKLKEILTDDEEKLLAEARSGAGFGGVPQPGQILSTFQQTRLKLSDD